MATLPYWLLIAVAYPAVRWPTLPDMDVMTAREIARRAALAAEYARIEAAIAAIRARLWERAQQGQTHG